LAHSITFFVLTFPPLPTAKYVFDLL